MPNPVDKCASCQSPVYAEDGIPGGCGCPERELRLLLANQKDRNSRGNAASAPDFASHFVGRTASADGLPELPAELLMSAAGRSELQAAQSFSPRGPTTFRQALAAPLRGRTELVAMLDDAAFFQDDSSGDGLDSIEGFDGAGLDGELESALGAGAQNRRRQVSASASAASSVDLSAMWMQGTGIPYDPAQLAVDGSPNDGFEFDTGDFAMRVPDYPSGGGPRGGGVRFRVDQPAPPPRPTFERPTREVARVGSNGRFAIITDQARAERAEHPIADDLRALERMARDAGNHDFNIARPEPPPRDITANQANARQSAVQQAKVLQARSKIPSVYDRLRKPAI